MPIVLGDAKDAERLSLMLADAQTVVTSPSLLDQQLTDHPDENLVIVGPDASWDFALQIAERYRRTRPSLGVIVVRRRLDVPILAAALRAGVREVIAADDAEALLAAYRRWHDLSKEVFQGETVKRDRGRVTMVFSPTGGSGRTTVAVNLANGILMQAPRSRVCIADLNIEFGDVALALQLEPNRTLSDALGMERDLDAAAASSLTVRHPDGFDALLAPRRPVEGSYITPTLAAGILTLLAQTHDHVIVDAEPSFNELMLSCFDLADSHIVLTGNDVLSLKNTRVALDTLDSLGHDAARRTKVLNRADPHLGLTRKDMEQALGTTFDVCLPASKDVPLATNRGVSIVRDRPRHPFSKGIRELATRELAGVAATRKVVA